MKKILICLIIIISIPQPILSLDFGIIDLNTSIFKKVSGGGSGGGRGRCTGKSTPVCQQQNNSGGKSGTESSHAEGPEFPSEAEILSAAEKTTQNTLNVIKAQSEKNLKYIQDSILDVDYSDIFYGSADTALASTTEDRISELKTKDYSLGTFGEVIDYSADRLKERGLFNDEDGTSEELFKILLKNNYRDLLNTTAIDENTGLPPGVEDRLEITITPANIRPGDTVNIKVRNLANPISSSFVIWTKDGRTILRGVGEDEVSTVINSQGTPESVYLYIQKEDGVEIFREIVLHPTEIDLIHEPITKTHPFYDGKPLFTHESSVKFIALPQIVGADGNILDFLSLDYEWRVNNKVIESGVGKNVIYYNSPFISEPIEVVVDVKTPDGSVTSNKAVYLTPGEPLVLIYEDNPIYGIIYEKAITSEINLDRKELLLKAVPFYFNNVDVLDFNWYVNNNAIPNFNDDYIILRNEEEGEGTSNIYIEVNNLNKRLQSNYQSFDIMFNN